MMLRDDHLPRLWTYAEALDYWTTRPVPRRGQWADRNDYGVRMLGGARQPYLQIRRGADASIACRYHRTDVVTYHPDGRIVLRPYASASTNTFANALLPRQIRVKFTRGYTVTLDAATGYRTYQLRSSCTLVPQGHPWAILDPAQDTVPWTRERVNRKVANAAYRQVPLAQFQDWFVAYQLMGGRMPRLLYPFEPARGRPMAETILECLPVWSRWGELVALGPNAVAVCRRAVLEATPGALVHTSQPFIAHVNPYRRNFP